MRHLLTSVLTAAVLWSGVAMAQDIGLRFPDTTGTRGTSVWLPIIADSSLTGANVTSFELQIQYSQGMAHPDSITSTGTLLEGMGWTVTMLRVDPDIIRIAAAGVTPLDGSGPLVFIRMDLLVSGWISVYFADASRNILNEGSPPVLLTNGSIQVSDPPSIDVWPDGDILAVGDQRQFSMGGGTEPISWSTSDPAVASIDVGGLLTAISPGTVHVLAEDVNGIHGTSDGVFVVRAIGIAVPDTAIPAMSIVEMPVTVTSLTAWNVLSGTVRLQYNPDVLTPITVSTGGGLLGALTPAVNLTQRGNVVVSFASAEPLIGIGTLFTVRFQAVVSSSWSDVTFGEALFNEDLEARTDNGSVSVAGISTINVDGEQDLLVEDTLQLSVWGGEGPYTWSSSDTMVATIDTEGRLVGIRGGSIRVTARDIHGAVGISGPMRVFDASMRIPHVMVIAGGTVDVPVFLDRLAHGRSYSSYQFTLSYDPELLRFIGATTTGTLTSSWATSHHVRGSELTVAGAASGALSSTGSIVFLRFESSSGIPLRSIAWLEVHDVILNEGSPSVMSVNGSVNFGQTPAMVELWSPADGAVEQSLTPHLTWSAVEFAERYELQVAIGSTLHAPWLDDSTLVTNESTIGPLENGTLYYWRVRALNSIGQGLWSMPMSFRTVATLPVAPSLVSPSDNAVNLSTTPTLIWNPVDQAESYYIQISEDSTFTVDVRNVGNVVDTQHLADWLPNGHRYYWRVRAFNQAGWSEWSERWSFVVVVASPGTPFQAEPLHGATGQSISPTLRWSRTNGSLTYDVQLTADAMAGTFFVDSSGIVDTQLTIVGLEHLRQYFWRVRAVNAGGPGGWTDYWSFETIIGSPAVPILSTPMTGAINVSMMPLLSWHRSTFASAYDLQLSEEPGFGSTVMQAMSIPDTSYPIGPLQPLHQYYWRVRSLNNVDTSVYSSTFQFTTGTTDAVAEDPGVIPEEFGLDPNFPNPFNPETEIAFRVKEAAFVTISIYSLHGAEVAQLVGGEMPAGRYRVRWSATNMSSGIYLCRMTAGQFTSTQRMILLK